MSGLYISSRIAEKLRDKHGLCESDVIEAFANRSNGYLTDKRAKHQTDPVTQWFIASNNMGKQIKVVFMQFPDGTILLKSAFIPDSDELRIYTKYAPTLA